MSIVRYVNKKTGRVALYESTSRYDPVLKQSRPVRKYLGTEDPVTHELIPSTHKRGRKAGSTRPVVTPSSSSFAEQGAQSTTAQGIPAPEFARLQALYEQTLAKVQSQEEKISSLQLENLSLKRDLRDVNRTLTTVARLIEDIQKRGPES